jgi:ribosomal protein S18 acetylase RimI-like enzyme
VNATISVRRGERADREFVRDLARRSAASSVSPVRNARHADVLDAFDKLVEFVYGRHHDVLIAEQGGERIGFLLLLYDVPDEVTLTEQAFVAYTAVEPFARGRGAGRALLDAAEAFARANGLRYVSLMVTDDNAPARGLYDKAGFVTERRMLTKRLD